MFFWLIPVLNCEPEPEEKPQTVEDEAQLDVDNDGDGFSELDGDCVDVDFPDEDGWPPASAIFPGSAVNEAVFGCMIDADGDGWGHSSPREGVAAGNDCDDLESSMNQDDEDGDGLSSCAGDCDDGDGLLNHQDSDFDNYSTCDGDCDDQDDTVFPGAAEDDSETACMQDNDGDGWGAPSPADGVEPGTDCNDFDARQNNSDLDSDGHTSCGGDCDDENPNMSLDDLDGDGMSACDGDCNDTDSGMNRNDADGDGHTSCEGDCDDGDANTYAGALEVCDGLYNNCTDPEYLENSAPFTEEDDDSDGSVECDDDGVAWLGEDPPSGYSDCDDASPVYNQNDSDGDGFTSCDGDCDDYDAYTFPGAAYEESGTECMTDEDGDGWGQELSCCFSLEMFDSWGDGWSGAYISAYSDGIASETYAVSEASGASETSRICLEDGVIFELGYTAGVAEFEGDNSFSLYDPDGVQVYSSYAGSSPPPGLAYSTNFIWADYLECTFNASISSGNDCDDGNSSIHFGAAESYSDNQDNNCNGITDGQSSVSYSDISITGAQSGEMLGQRVRSAGDVDGDGRSDLLVSSSINDDGGTDAGKAYLFFGTDLSGEMDADSASMVFVGEAAEDRAGFSFTSAGDVNGDEKYDLLIGAPYNDDYGNAVGKVYLLSGESISQGTASLQTPDLALYGENDVDLAGYDVAAAGDIDDDGFDDILIGARNSDEGGNKAGKMYLFKGSSITFGEASLSTADISFIGEAPEDHFHKAAPAGDVDGDGLDDIVMASADNDDGALNAGKVYLIVGTSFGTGTFQMGDADAQYTGVSEEDHAGHSIAGGGDLNGDGLDDLLVGAYGIDSNGADSGAVYVITDASMQTSMVSLETAEIQLNGEAQDDWAGFSVASLTDSDGDGLPEVLVGAPQNDDAFSNAGKAYVVYGGSLGPGVFGLEDADLSYSGEDTNNYAGYDLAMAGDVNNDGLKDLLIGAYGNNSNGPNTGRVYLFTDLMD
jgi:hypothetical protein